MAGLAPAIRVEIAHHELHVSACGDHLRGHRHFGRPSVIVVLGYGLAFYFLSLTLRTIPVGIAYALWSGIGIALIALAGWIIYRQPLDMPALIGMGLILAGVLVINLFSKTASH